MPGETGNKGRTDLNKHLSATITLSWGAIHRHGLPVTGELQSKVLLHKLLHHLLGSTDGNLKKKCFFHFLFFLDKQTPLDHLVSENQIMKYAHFVAE